MKVPFVKYEQQNWMTYILILKFFCSYFHKFAYLQTISIPTSESRVDYAFSLSSLEDAHGPQGSFECLEAANDG